MCNCLQTLSWRWRASQHSRQRLSLTSARIVDTFACRNVKHGHFRAKSKTERSACLIYAKISPGSRPVISQDCDGRLYRGVPRFSKLDCVGLDVSSSHIRRPGRYRITCRQEPELVSFALGWAAGTGSETGGAALRTYDAHHSRTCEAQREGLAATLLLCCNGGVESRRVWAEETSTESAGCLALTMAGWIVWSMEAKGRLPLPYSPGAFSSALKNALLRACNTWAEEVKDGDDVGRMKEGMQTCDKKQLG